MNLARIDTRATLKDCERRIFSLRADLPAARSLLVAISGIDGSGKGYTSSLLAEYLRARALSVAVLNIDGWLNLPSVRFRTSRPHEHFYRNAIRFDEMFRNLVLPLRDRRSVRLEADFAEETASSYRRHLYAYEDVDVILLEGIYLLKREHRHHYDLSIWVECSFETALERAITRSQEGLTPAETVRAYRTIYFPAQALHFAVDGPRDAADLVVLNDAELD
ncbi:MAG TPA: uridine kinase [Vicinamibacteria bacterium]|nr:uridine kinase [Vicinamibacteria bacterium]